MEEPPRCTHSLHCTLVHALRYIVLTLRLIDQTTAKHAPGKLARACQVQANCPGRYGIQ